MNRLCLATGLLALSLASAASAEKPSSRELRETSWGKPGVSLEQYRMDAGICAWQATNMDISHSKPAKTMVKASQALEHQTHWIGMVTSVNGASSMAGAAISMRNVEDRFRVDKQFEEVADMQYDALHRCLRERGYTRFQLTAEQAKRLRKLRSGTMKRHLYMHSLGSNPVIVASQAL